MSILWDEIPIHVIDFEGSPQCGIVEFGVVSLRGAKIESKHTRLCRPKAAIPRNEQALHRIDSETAQQEAPFLAEWDLFADLREQGPLAAHFASAENSMLKSAFPYPRLSPDWTNPPRKIALWGPWLDTGGLYRDFGDDGSSLKLEDLVLRHELQDDLDGLAEKCCPDGRIGYHRALYDALASTLLLINYCQELCDEKPTLRQLIARSQGSAEKRQEVEQQRLF